MDRQSQPPQRTEAPLVESPGFLSLWKRLGGGVISVQTDGLVGSPLTGVRFGTGPISRIQIGPEGLPGDAEERRSFEDRRRLIEQLKSMSAAHVVLSDLSVWPVDEQWKQRTVEQLTVTLDRSDWEPFDATLRSEWRRSEREGVTCERITADENDAEWLSCIVKWERAERKKRYPIELWRGLGELSTVDDRVLLTVARHRDAICAVHIYLLLTDQLALHWHGWMDRGARAVKPVVALHVFSNRLLHQRGCTRVSLGASPESADGLKSFKAKWADGTLTQYIYRLRQGLGRLWE